MNTIKYLGQIIDNNDRRPHPTRASAMRDISASENVNFKQSFLGLVNYYKVFEPNMYCLRALSNKLLKRF